MDPPEAEHIEYKGEGKKECEDENCANDKLAQDSKVDAYAITLILIVMSLIIKVAYPNRLPSFKLELMSDENRKIMRESVERIKSKFTDGEHKKSNTFFEHMFIETNMKEVIKDMMSRGETSYECKEGEESRYRFELPKFDLDYVMSSEFMTVLFNMIDEIDVKNVKLKSNETKTLQSVETDQQCL